MQPSPIERLVLKPIAADMAFVDVRLPGIALYGLKATRQPDGSVLLEPPSRPDRTGRRWPIYTLQPGLREHVAAVVTRDWPLAAGAADKGAR